jgi:hypothetical protein
LVHAGESVEQGCFAGVGIADKRNGGSAEANHESYSPLSIWKKGWRDGLRKEDNTYAGGFIAAQTQAVITQANLHWVSQRSKADDFNLLVFEHAHFHQALKDEIISEQAFDAGTLAFLQLIEGHGFDLVGQAFLQAKADTNVCPTPRLNGYRTYENLHRPIAAQAQSRFPNLQQTRAASLQDVEPTANAHPHFRQSAHPARFASYVGDIGPIAGVQEFQR